MNEENIRLILNAEKVRKATVSDKNRLLKAYKEKRGISAQTATNTKIQKSPNQETIQTIISDRIILLEQELVEIEEASLTFWQIIDFLGNNKEFDSIDEMIIYVYYAENSSFRGVSRELELRSGIFYDHKKVKREIDKIISKIALHYDDPNSPN